MTSVSHSQRAAAWLALLVAVLIAVTPSAGVMVCLGHDGHVGIGAPSEAGSCPCGHEAHAKAEAEADVHQQAPERGVPTLDERQPPCTDVALDPPEAFRTGDLGVSLPDAPEGAPDDPRARAFEGLAAWLRRELRAAEEAVAPAAWAAWAAERPPSFLVHKRSIVLLI